MFNNWLRIAELKQKIADPKLTLNKLLHDDAMYHFMYNAPDFCFTENVKGDKTKLHFFGVEKIYNEQYD
jgi:hypothetical protein